MTKLPGLMVLPVGIVFADALEFIYFGQQTVFISRVQIRSFHDSKLNFAQCFESSAGRFLEIILPGLDLVKKI